MDEGKRQSKLEAIALDMYAVGMGWHLDALERLVRPPIGDMRAKFEIARSIVRSTDPGNIMARKIRGYARRIG